MYRLTYFDAPGRAETARLLFSLAEQPFEDIRVSFGEWAKLKPECPFGQLPMLEVDGLKVSQSRAIDRFLANRFGFNGSSETERLQIDMVVDCVEDIFMKVRPLMYGRDQDKTEARRAEVGAKVQEELGQLEQLLAANRGGDGFFVGDKVSWADLEFDTRMNTLKRAGLTADWAALPKLAALRERVALIPQVAAWRAKASKPKYRLTYYDIEARGTPIRLMLTMAGVPFEDVRFQEDDIEKYRPETPYGEFPILEIEGQVFCQTNAICKYLGGKLGFAGKNELEALRCDMVADCLNDLTLMWNDIFFSEGEKQAQLMKRYQEEVVPPLMAKYEKLLIDNQGGDGFFVGDSLTWVDLIYDMIWLVLDVAKAKVDMTAAPKMAALRARIRAVPKVAEYYAKVKQ